MKQQLIIVGDSAFAQIAFEYFSDGTQYHPVCFAVERSFTTRDNLLGLPVCDLETIEVDFPAAQHSYFVAVVYGQMNRTRERLYLHMKQRGYSPASYISPSAFVWKNVRFGEHCFIFENNVVQPFAEIGNNVILWSGNHVGHHSKIHDNCFISSHVVVSGFCNVGRNSFLGVNASIANNVSVAADCWLSPGVAVTKNIERGTLVFGTRPTTAEVTTYRFFDIEEAQA